MLNKKARLAYASRAFLLYSVNCYSITIDWVNLPLFEETDIR